jgi:hypothetical protein
MIVMCGLVHTNSVGNHHLIKPATTGHAAEVPPVILQQIYQQMTQVCSQTIR